MASALCYSSHRRAPRSNRRRDVCSPGGRSDVSCQGARASTQPGSHERDATITTALVSARTSLLLSDAARAILRIVDDWADRALFRIGAALEVLTQAPVGVHAHSQVFGVLTDVYGNSQRLGHAFGFVGRVIDPATPPPVGVN